MKTKAQKTSLARKNAEAIKAQKKAQRNAKNGTASTVPTKKGKSIVPQSKAKKK